MTGLPAELEFAGFGYIAAACCALVFVRAVVVGFCAALRDLLDEHIERALADREEPARDAPALEAAPQLPRALAIPTALPVSEPETGLHLVREDHGAAREWRDVVDFPTFTPRSQR